jgi:hypothetical protein
MLLVDNEELKIYVDREPFITVKNSRYYSKEEMEKPYLNKTRCVFTIFYKEEQYVILCQKNYDWDGASIPFGFRWLIGAKGSPQFLVPSMVHDKLCENHSFVKNDRYLSSLIFRELLIAYGVGKFKANVMFNAVDNFQKLFGGW